ncbi:efflux RND transporter periplasmic adaptor subunit (plasmid) [Methylomonas sp. MED-D]|uniref:efflux RND transporter periplasmic adaptor subunit n=1 Tax=Methylomonas sp. MED-D TaxID=3418768 RepID=UPI003CFDEB88
MKNHIDLATCQRSRVSLAAFIFCLSACSHEPAPEPKPRPVRVTSIHFDTGSTSVRYSGEIKARYENPLAFQVSGKLVKRLVDVGTVVKQGQILAIIDPADILLDQAGSAGQLAAAQAELDLARRELRHLTNLEQMELASEATLERRRDQVNAAEAKVISARALHGQATRKSGYSELRSDFNGVITAVEAEPGQVIEAGQTIVRLARTDAKEVIISVPENRLQDLRAASALRVSLWAAPENHYVGRLREISPGVDPVLRTYTAKIALTGTDNTVALGMTATVQVETPSANPSARLPLTALTTFKDQPTVWVVDPDAQSVKPRSVTLAGYDSTAVTVLGGVAEGEQVVTAGVHKLIANQKVRLLEVQP